MEDDDFEDFEDIPEPKKPKSKAPVKKQPEIPPEEEEFEEKEDDDEQEVEQPKPLPKLPPMKKAEPPVRVQYVPVPRAVSVETMLNEIYEGQQEIRQAISAILERLGK